MKGWPVAEPIDVWFDDSMISATCFRCGQSFDFSEDGEGRGDSVYCQPCAESLFIRCDGCENDYWMKDFDFTAGHCKNCEYEQAYSWIEQFDSGEEGHGL